MKKQDNKQRLFEVLGKIDPTFKSKLNEVEDKDFTYAAMDDTGTMKSVPPTPQKSIFKQWFDGERHGEGSFMSGLLDLFLKADSGNKRKLQNAFPDVFSPEDIKYFTGESAVKENLQEWNFDKKKGEDKEEDKKEDKEDDKDEDKKEKKDGKKKWNFEKKEDKESEEHEEAETPEEEKKEHKEKKELGEQEDNDGKKIPVTFWDKAKHGK